MQALYLVCVVFSGLAMVVITLIIPAGVFMRYVMDSALSWPEPASVILMVMFSFLGGAAVYRAKGHVAVQALLSAVSPGKRRAMLIGVDACMIATALFMVYYGAQLCMTTWYQSISEFPELSVGLTYMPIPVAGVLTLLFIFERIWLGEAPKDDVMYSDAPVEHE